MHIARNFTYNGEFFSTALDFNSPQSVSTFVSNHIKNNRKINNKLYNINTNSYESLTNQKDIKIVELYNELEKYVLKKDKKIIRNYLKKCIAFKLNKKIMEVMIKERELLITFLRDVKLYDNENRLFIRRGYENSSLCYGLYIKDTDSFNYALKLFDKEYEIITNPDKMNRVNVLLKETIKRINKIDNNIKFKKINKGIMFCAKRSFTIIEKRKYGLHIRLLPIEDKDNIL